MTLILVVAAAAAVVWVVLVVPWWEQRAARQAVRRAECERYGHRWGRIFNVYDDPGFPVRHCERCGEQENLSRCPMCRKTISKGRVLDE